MDDSISRTKQLSSDSVHVLFFTFLYILIEQLNSRIQKYSKQS